MKTTSERLWEALTEPRLTTQYWGVTFETDWTAESAMVWMENGCKTDAPGQHVLVSDQGHRLSYTWHAFTKEWAEAVGVPTDVLAKLQNEPRTHVTFEIEEIGQMVRLAVTHSGFGDDSTMLAMCSQAWPLILSSLKTLLETGEPLPTP
ncbi:SRPBCC domain-containing protein [Nocardia sp. NPDC004260]